MALVVALTFDCFAAEHQNGRQLFNDHWKFCLLKDTSPNANLQFAAVNFADQDWDNVTLPHTAHLEPYVVTNQWQGICWYRKHFRVPRSALAGKVFITFEAAMNVSDVWVNGTHKMTHLGGFLPVVVDVTDTLQNGDNVVAVRLDNRDNPLTGPQPLKLLDFNTYGGLYRNAYITFKNSLYITDPILENKIGGGGVFVSYPEVSPGRAKVQVNTHIRNASGALRHYRIVNQLWEQSKLRAQSSSGDRAIPASAAAEAVSELALDHPRLWSPQHPSLYTLQTKMMENGRIIEQHNTVIGIRSIEFRNNELYLNGGKCWLTGVNRHQEYPFVGYALSDNAQWRDATKIKEAGFDYVRLSHYPQSPAFLDACDRLGLLVLDAVLGWQYFVPDNAFQTLSLQSCRDLIRRDRNHPCILAWETSLNESGMTESFMDKAGALVHEEYPYGKGYSAGWLDYPAYDIYIESRQTRLSNQPHPYAKPFIVSEYGDWEYYAMNAGLDQHLWRDLKPSERSSRQLREYGQARMLQQAANIQEAHNDNLKLPAFGDGYWVMFDYNRGYADDLESSGIMSLERLPKFSYYFFRSQRPPKHASTLCELGAMVHIASYWEAESPLSVRVFSNCEQVELQLNGKSIARQSPDRDRISDALPHPPFSFTVKAYERGELMATGYIGGTPVAEHRVRTPESPSQMVLRADNLHIDITTQDMCFLYADIIDEHGTVVPVSEGSVKFTIQGDAMFVGENPSQIRAGTAFAVIKTGTHSGVLQIAASTDHGMKKCMKLKVRPSSSP